MVVHILGAVHNPGLIELPVGSRVWDALVAAGGLTDQADPAELNLAGPLWDGCQIVVGTRAEPRGEVRAGPGGSTESGQAGSATGGTIDLNSATAQQLESLPGVGPVTAAAILAWRTQHGRFTTVAELQEVDGIGPKTYAQIAPRVRV
jgi:competence protein ComEA